jgi:hypothetical protein
MDTNGRESRKADGIHNFEYDFIVFLFALIRGWFVGLGKGIFRTSLKKEGIINSAEAGFARGRAR